MTSRQLHLLRGVPPNINGEAVSLEQFRRLARIWAINGSIFGSWARRRPRRADELKGGSVYFVQKKTIIFRMPFLGLERVRDFNPDAEPYYFDHTAICCAPEIIDVVPTRIGWFRGWRYAEDKDVPRDLAAEDRSLPDWYIRGEQGLET